MDGKIGLDTVFSDVLSRRNVLLLVLFWAGGLLLLASYGTVSGRLGSAAVVSPGVRPAPAANETGSFSAQSREAAGQSTASYRVVFDNLSATNRTLGLFRTASHKQVRIENLRVAFVTAPNVISAKPVRLRDFCDLFAPRTGNLGKTGPLGVFDEFGAGESNWSVGVDLSNATEVRIENLDWSVCVGEATTLRVQCRHARLEADTAHVVLRGHATVTTPEAVLESNCIEMDVQDECFVVDGRYLLTQGQRKQRGQRGRFDAALGVFRAVSLDTGENRVWADGSRHGPF